MAGRADRFNDEEKDIITTDSEGRIRKQGLNPKYDNNYFKWGLTIFLTFLCCILSVYLVFFNDKFVAQITRINKILAPVYVGLIIAYLFSPLLNSLENKVIYPIYKKIGFIKEENKKKHSRFISIVIIVIFTVILIYAIIQLTLDRIIPSLLNIVKNLDNYLNNLTLWVDKLLEDNEELNNFIVRDMARFNDDITAWVDTNIKDMTARVIKALSQGFLVFLKKTWNFIIGFIISIYVLWSKEAHVARTKKLVYAFFSRETANALVEAFRYTHRTFIGFFFGKIVDSIIIGLICYIACTLMQIPFTLIVSIIIGVTNIIPFFGPYFGAIPSAILIFSSDPMHPGKAIAFVIFILILQQFDGNFLGPQILSTSTGLTGFWVIFSITLFGGLFGLFGMVIGVPVFAVIYAGVKQISRNKLKKKGYPYKTKDYVDVGTIAEDGSINPIPPVEKKHQDESFVASLIKSAKAKREDKKSKGAGK